MTKRKWFEGWAEAYFTVEAAIVMPIALSVILFILYAMFFQYDRCLLEQDMGALALRGAAMQVDDKEVLAREIKEQANRIDYGKYLMWECGEINLRLEGNKLCISREGQLKYPFSSFGIGGERHWKAETRYENVKINPTSFVRTCRKLTGGK